ncbi:MAG: magnesium-translocating P-type ATPase [Planctomycetaceae bacterium]|nr:magnesium-translocating P-type ATPase [Planctomycetaceae bacterium]
MSTVTPHESQGMNNRLSIFWSMSPDEVMGILGTTADGLGGPEADRRQVRKQKSTLLVRRHFGSVGIFFSQFKSPIILILIFASLLSFFLHDDTDALIILFIVLLSGLLGFWQENRSANAVARLLALVQTKITVLRDNAPTEIPLDEVVPGDIIILSAGDTVPADGLLLEAKDLFVNEAALTGETYPAEKIVSAVPPQTPLASRKNSVFMGTYVVSGSANAVAVQTGSSTEFGHVSERLKHRLPPTEFEHGLRRFGYFLMEVTLLLIIIIFAVNVYLRRPVLDAFLFSLALAVGLTPQLLPAIVSVNLAHGARQMAGKKVIVKRLASIENFGSMNVLCCDKTGTLTKGLVTVESATDARGKQNDKILLYAYLNSFFEKGFRNPMDEAVRNYRQFEIGAFQKLDEIPYDFIRKRLSVLVSEGPRRIIITKGALTNVLELCTTAELADGSLIPLSDLRTGITNQFEEMSRRGFRVLAVAYRDFKGTSAIEMADEMDMTFLGLLAFADPLKQGLTPIIEKLNQLGIQLKIITGDNRHAAGYIARQLGLKTPGILTGPDLHKMSDDALLRQVAGTDIFAEVEPNQKEQIILVLRKLGHITGFMGDGINDASALHAADVGISVDSAVDVAKDAADIILLEKDLAVLLDGVRDGRMTFANTLKYVFMATSANFGNLFTMAAASLILPFLPLLPKQILLVNLLTDLPEMAIAGDSVDSEMLNVPHRWDIHSISRFMVIFGLLSSIFDAATFMSLLLVLGASTEQLRTGWFVESIFSASLVVMVIRTRRPFFRSIPGKYLLLATLFTLTATVLMPFIPLRQLFQFVPLPISFWIAIAAIVALYVISAELLKTLVYRKLKL